MSQVGSFPGDTIFAIYEAVHFSNPLNSADNASLGSQGSSQASLLTQTFKILKVPKLMRLGRLFKTLEKLEGAANVANILILLLTMVVINHWISCVWFFATKVCHTPSRGNPRGRSTAPAAPESWLRSTCGRARKAGWPIATSSASLGTISTRRPFTSRS